MKMRNIVVIAVMIFSGCGEEHVVDKYRDPPPVPSPGPNPTPTPTPDPGGGDKIGYQQMQAHLVNYCQSCHASAQFMTSEAALKANKSVKEYLWSRRMPPSSAPKALPDNVRTQMIGFF